MAEETVGKDRAHYEGPDKPFYKGGGGRIFGAASYGNDDGFGTPSHPGLRGEAYGGHVPSGDSTPKRNGELDHFFKGKK